MTKTDKQLYTYLLQYIDLNTAVIVSHQAGKTDNAKRSMQELQKLTEKIDKLLHP